MTGYSQDIAGLNGTTLARTGLFATPLPVGATVDSALTFAATPSLNEASWTDGAFLGLRLPQADGMHYGFLHLQYSPGGAYATIGDFAYESVPNAPIVTTTPEPASIAVAGLAMLVMSRRQRRGDRAPH